MVTRVVTRDLARPLKVALLHVAHPRAAEQRAVGIWSYEVPQLEVTHFPQVHRTPNISRPEFRDFDVMWHEDCMFWGTYHGSGPPVCYYVTDSTLSDEHYQTRRRKASEMDAVFVDWDKLGRFSDTGVRTFRCGYCVNDRLYRDYGLPKDIDVGFYCGLGEPGGEERRRMAWLLEEICADLGYRFDATLRPGEEYAKAMNRTKVVVQLSRTPTTRAHRTFDAMACGACLLTDPLPLVSDEVRGPGHHYLEYSSTGELPNLLRGLIDSGSWELYAKRGKELVGKHHTWAVRAEELHRSLLGVVSAKELSCQGVR